MPHEFQHVDPPTWCLHCGRIDLHCRDDDQCDRSRPGQYDARTAAGAARIAGVLAGLGAEHPVGCFCAVCLPWPKEEEVSPLKSAEEMMVIDYQEYIASAAWREKRVAVIRRARGLCERCKKWPIVNVHHLTYERLGDEQLEDLLGVCSSCHRELHE